MITLLFAAVATALPGDSLATDFDVLCTAVEARDDSGSRLKTDWLVVGRWLRPQAGAAADESEQQEHHVEDFDFLWNEVETRYAYGDRSWVHWAETRQRHRQRAAATTNEAELLSVLEDLLEGLRDHHVHFAINNERSPRLVPSHLDLWVEWIEGEARVTSVRRGSDAARAGIVPGEIVRKIRGQPPIELVARRLGKVDGAVLEDLQLEAANWALRAEVVGRWNQRRALTVVGPAGERALTLGEGWAPTHEGLLHCEVLGKGAEAVGYVRVHNALGNPNTVAAFDRALASLRETQALIIDLRETPSGGNTTVARGILGHFVLAPKPYQRHLLVEEGRQTGVPRSWTEEVSPRGAAPYKGRVVVLVGRWTGSMGEGLAIGFDAIGAEVVGEPMAGLLGALTEVKLPHAGWTARFANEALFSVDGTARERWVPPNQAADPTPGDAHDEVLEVALQLARAK